MRVLVRDEVPPVSIHATGFRTYGVLLGHDQYSVAEYTTRREAERHAARIRRALKGER